MEAEKPGWEVGRGQTTQGLLGHMKTARSH